MKKGFTIIEIVIALAILLVAVTSVNLIYSTSSQIWKLSGYNANTAALNQAVSQRMRAEGKRNVVNIFNTTHNYYIYFNNVDGITNGVTTNDGIDDAIDLAINGTVDNKFKVLGGSVGNLADCKLNNGNKTRYGALVMVSKLDDTNNKLYEFDITVWDLKRNNDLSKSNSVFSIGR